MTQTQDTHDQRVREAASRYVDNHSFTKAATWSFAIVFGWWTYANRSLFDAHPLIPVSLAVLFGAALGGLCGWIVLDPMKDWRRTFGLIGGICGALVSFDIVDSRITAGHLDPTSLVPAAIIAGGAVTGSFLGRFVLVVLGLAIWAAVVYWRPAVFLYEKMFGT